MNTTISATVPVAWRRATVVRPSLHMWSAVNLAVEGAAETGVVAGFVRANLTSRSMTRLLIWEGLTGTGMDDTDLPYFAQMVADVRLRQERGEIAADLDPIAVLLAVFSAALAPTLLPHVVERVTGQVADSSEFLDDYAARLARIVQRPGP